MNLNNNSWWNWWEDEGESLLTARRPDHPNRVDSPDDLVIGKSYLAHTRIGRPERITVLDKGREQFEVAGLWRRMGYYADYGLAPYKKRDGEEYWNSTNWVEELS